jgi:hypothetical protein
MFVIPKGKDGLTEVCAGGKSMLIFGSNEIDRETIGLKKISEKPTEIKLVFFRGDIRFRRFSATNQIHSCGFDSGVIWGEKRRTMRVPECQKQLALCLRVEYTKLYLHTMITN